MISTEKKGIRIRKELFVSSSKTKNIKEDYDYVRELGAGGYGVVFLAQHKITSNIIFTHRLKKSYQDHLQGRCQG